MFDLLNLNPGSFGLDISDRSLKLAALKGKKGNLRFAALGQTALAKGIIEQGEVKEIEKLSEAIKNLMAKSPKVKTRHVVMSLPEEKSFIRLLQMPKMNRKEIKSAVRFEAENYIPFSIEKVYLDSQIIAPVSPRQDYTEVLLAALPRKTVDPYVSALYKAGLVPEAMETESLATVRALIKDGAVEKPVFIADIGLTCTNLSVYFGSSLRFTSFIPFSSHKLTEAIAQNLRVDLKEARKLKFLYGFQKTGKRSQRVYAALLTPLTEFAWEVKKHIDYYQTHAQYEQVLREEQQIEKLLLSGGGANLKGLLKFLSEETGLMVQKGNPLINLPWEEKNNKDLSRQKILPFATAIGLALRNYKI